MPYTETTAQHKHIDTHTAHIPHGIHITNTHTIVTIIVVVIIVVSIVSVCLMRTHTVPNRTRNITFDISWFLEASKSNESAFPGEMSRQLKAPAALPED